MRKKELERQEAIRLRKEGKSLNEIASAINVSKASVSCWVKDVPLSAEQRAWLFEKQQRLCQGNELKSKKCLESRILAMESGVKKAKEKNPLHMAGCFLYWGEGAKCGNRIKFCNTDADMMKLFVKFLKESLMVKIDFITISINVYLNNGLTLKNITDYWLNKLDLPITTLRKSVVNNIPKSSSKKSKIRHPYGVCTITVNNTSLIQHIYGAIQEYGGFKRPEWLTLGLKAV